MCIRDRDWFRLLYPFVQVNNNNLCLILNIIAVSYTHLEGNMWALTGGGLFRYDEKADSFVTYPPLEMCIRDRSYPD